MDEKSNKSLKRKICRKLKKEYANIPESILFSLPSTNYLQPEELNKIRWEVCQMFVNWKGSQYIKECEEIGAKAMIAKYDYSISAYLDNAEIILESLVTDYANELLHRFAYNPKNGKKIYDRALNYLFFEVEMMCDVWESFRNAIRKAEDT